MTETPKINLNEPHFSVNYVHTVFIELQLVNCTMANEMAGRHERNTSEDLIIQKITSEY